MHMVMYNRYNTVVCEVESGRHIYKDVGVY